MPPRLRLTPDEARRLPALLKFQSQGPDTFHSCASLEERVVWILQRYHDTTDAPLTAPLITLLLFEQGPNVALRSVLVALANEQARGTVFEVGSGYALVDADPTSRETAPGTS
ncbi:MAG TPA: hypothetical protein QGF05_09625 [Dehalococcoidia bacterium]|nr:hypothetical protein [Dehalococcoidia bacterium]